MDLITTLRVHNRVNTPALLPANISRILEPGHPLQVTEVVPGQAILGNNKWLKLTDGSFVWTGGTNYDGNYPWWITGCDIPDLWLKATGAGVKIGLLDTGVQPDHPAFRNRVAKLEYDAKMEQVPDETPEDASPKYHGTRCAGMIIGHDAVNNTNCCGIAPDSALYSYKVQNQYGDDPDYIVQGLKAAIADQVHIISISRNVLLTPEVNAQLAEAEKNKILVVVCSGSLGDANQLISVASVISVSAIGADGTGQLPGGAGPANPTDAVTCFAPGIGIRTTDNNGGYTIPPVSGTSFATPFVAGALALRIQQLGADNRAYFDNIRSDLINAVAPNAQNLPVLNLKQLII